MRGLITIAALLIAGQASAGEQVISVQHDSARGVTCWILNNTGISCLPDSSLPQVNASTSAEESQVERASLASVEVDTGRLTAAPLPQKKGLQL